MAVDDSEKVGNGIALAHGRQPRRQARSDVTRRELVDAAREIFARDGFEQARLEDIAAAAGKTRGAFYAHFQDKEDVFFAIFEDDLARDEQAILAALVGTSTAQDRRKALGRLLADIGKDRRRVLLSIEFKLYAIRHPHQHRRLATLHSAMKLRCVETHIDRLLPELHGALAAHKREIAAQLGSLVEGLGLNRLFDPQSIRQGQLDALLQAGIETILGGSEVN